MIAFSREKLENHAMPLSSKIVASGLKSPVYAAAPTGDTARLFLVERGDANHP